MTARAPAALVAAALLATVPPAGGCAFAVEHPAVTAGIVGGTLGLATCKLASDDLAACFAVGGGAGVFLGLVAAAALWLGGDGHSGVVEEQAKPLPEDDRPRKRPRRPADPPADPGADPGAPTTTPAPPTSPPPATPPGATPPSRSALRLPSATPRVDSLR